MTTAEGLGRRRGAAAARAAAWHGEGGSGGGGGLRGCGGEPPQRGGLAARGRRQQETSDRHCLPTARRGGAERPPAGWGCAGRLRARLSIPRRDAVNFPRDLPTAKRSRPRRPGQPETMAPLPRCSAAGRRTDGRPGGRGGEGRGLSSPEPTAPPRWAHLWRWTSPTNLMAPWRASDGVHSEPVQPA